MRWLLVGLGAGIVAFAWRLSERLSSDALAFMIGAVFILGILVVVGLFIFVVSTPNPQRIEAAPPTPKQPPVFNFFIDARSVHGYANQGPPPLPPPRQLFLEQKTPMLTDRWAGDDTGIDEWQ